jgi:uncharacterized membrane protein
VTKETFVFIAGILLTLLPFLGIPLVWRQYLIFGIGVLLIIAGYILRRQIFLERIDRGNGERGNDSFVETTEKLFGDENS